MQVPDSLLATMPPRSADPVQPVGARGHEAFWEEVLNDATAIQGQADAAANSAPAPQSLVQAVMSPPDRSGGLQSGPVANLMVAAPGVLAGTSASLETLRVAGAANELPQAVLPFIAEAETNSTAQAGRSAIDRKRADPASTHLPQGGSLLAPHHASAAPAPWRATLVVDEQGQRKLFLRASQLTPDGAMALAAQLSIGDGQPGRAGLEAIHLNGQPIYRQSDSGASDTLLIC